MKTCALCGDLILEKPSDPDAVETDEHVPPLQFFPKAMRTEMRARLWKVLSHKRCNHSYKLDEEYFLPYVYPLVGNQNQRMGKILFEELKRRAKKPQLRGLIRRVLKEMTHVSPGGILLPPNLIRVNFNLKRIQRVVVKIAQCLFYKDFGRYVPRSACDHIELCETVMNLQPFYAELRRCQEVEQRSAAPDVFRYWHIDHESENRYLLLFWEAFAFCLNFTLPTSIYKHESDGGKPDTC